MKKIRIKNIKSFHTTEVDGKQHATIIGDEETEITEEDVEEARAN